jgi:sec-independent protein translocase protein TatB
MMRKFGRFTGKMRALAFEFKQGIDELGRQAELEELRKEVADLKKHTGLEDIQKEFEEDKRALESDVNKTLAPTPSPTPTPAHPAAAANGATPPAMAPHAGLSADHPGYDTGEDFRLEGHGPPPPPDATPPDTAQTEPVQPTQPPPKTAAEPAAPPPPRPVKQDTPA